MRYRWFPKHKDSRDVDFPYEEPEQPAAPPRKKLGHGEKAGVLLAAVILFYGLITGDLPLAFFCLALVLFCMRPLAVAYGGPRGESLANLMKGFSFSLFLGTIIWILL